MYLNNSTEVNFLNNQSRIGEDKFGLSQTNMQNSDLNSYMLKNFYLQDCGMQKPIDIATRQPSVFYSGSNGLGLGGCNVDESSKLLIGKEQTNPKCRISLIERPYKTVPYLGRGPSNSMLESQLRQGTTMTNRKSVLGTSEESYMGLKNYPLVNSIENGAEDPTRNISCLSKANSSYDVKPPRTHNPTEESVDRNWIRGGLASRDLTRKTVN